MTDQQAMEMSRQMAALDIFPEAKEVFARELLAYYKQLLARPDAQPIPTTRRTA